MPANAPADPPFWPDSLAPADYDIYVFGFRDVTGLSATEVTAQRGQAQISAPVLVFDEEDDVFITLTNLGLPVRPDLIDGHTIHWHGFVNAIPLFDGVPELSISVPIGRDFTYFYRPHDAGTYMYHCHFEDVEHVQMGMTGIVFVRPKQNATGAGGFGPGSTPTTTATGPPATTASSRSCSPSSGRRPTTGTRTSRPPTGPTTSRASGCSTAVPTRTPSRPTATR